MNITGDIANTRNSGYRGGYILNQIGDPSVPRPRSNVMRFNTAAFATPVKWHY